MAANGDRKSTGGNFGCVRFPPSDFWHLASVFRSHSFSQSSSDGNEELKEVEG
jgi:hypothetical protein